LSGEKINYACKMLKACQCAMRKYLQKFSLAQQYQDISINLW
jgi:hypothetical protein